MVGGGSYADVDFEVASTRDAYYGARRARRSGQCTHLKAIQAVVLVNLDARQVDAASRAGATIKSILNHAPLAQKVLQKQS